ncbi:MAG: beta-lactamase family protein [Maribacter sp.]|nr:beta-lactamase family protein [Maribacter sp.]
MIKNALRIKSVIILLFLLGMARQGNAQIPSSLDTYLDQVYQSHVIPGFSVIVVDNQQVLYSKGFGKEQLGQAASFTPRSVSAIGSLTKSLTAMAIMQLVEQGALELDAPIVDYLPWFRTANKEKSDKVTIRMLLNNTSRLYANPFPSYELSDQALEKLGHSLEGSFITKEPGSAYEYSNLGFSLAGLLVHEVSEEPYMDYLEKHIFKPLEMNSTSTDPVKFEALGALEGHYHGIERCFPSVREQQMESGEYIPAGSFTRSNSLDLSHYLMALLNKGNYKNERLLSSKSIEEMWYPNSSFPGLSKEQGGDGKPIFYGLGWMISDIEGRRIVHHGGSTGKMSSMTMIDPENNLAVSLLANVDLTFIDQYQYPRAFTIVNNLLCLARGEAITNMGKPIILDPSINEFELAVSKAEKYLGEYTQVKGGDHWVNFGLTLKIKQQKEGCLEATLYRGKQTINNFRLDFVNESHAISRNMGVPQQVQFKITPDGQVQGLFSSGVEYLKLENTHAQTHRMVNLQHNIQFLLPNNWELVTTVNGFYATDKGNPRNLLRGWFTEDKRGTTIENFKKAISNNKIQESDSHNQIEGQLVWKHRTVLNGQENNKLLHTFFESKLEGKQIALSISTDQENHTLILQRLMVPLLKSLKTE